jgi:hypothetical protein
MQERADNIPIPRESQIFEIAEMKEREAHAPVLLRGRYSYV